MATETLMWLIPLPPVLAFALIVLLTHRSKALSHTIAIGAALLSWLGSRANRAGQASGRRTFTRQTGTPRA